MQELQNSLWSFLQPLLKFGLVPDLLVQCSETRMTFQNIWYLRLAFCYVAVEESEEADVCKAKLSGRKKWPQFQNLVDLRLCLEHFKVTN